MTDLQAVRSRAPDGIGFYGGPFSNFQRSPIGLPHPFPDREGEICVYPTVEHRFQAMKATNRADHDLIAVRGSPAEAKIKGRGIKLRPDWETVKWDVMVEALRAKFAIPEFRSSLLTTGDKFIYEDSPTDAQWGLWNAREKAWTGKNLLGEALMLIRSEIVS